MADKSRDGTTGRFTSKKNNTNVTNSKKTKSPSPRNISGQFSKSTELKEQLKSLEQKYEKLKNKNDILQNQNIALQNKNKTLEDAVDANSTIIGLITTLGDKLEKELTKCNQKLKEGYESAADFGFYFFFLCFVCFLCF